jgi:hypothetical protein
MLSDDPYSVARPVVPKVQEPDFRTEFWREAPDMRPTRGNDRMATSNVCRYLNGRHEMPPREFCPHFKYEDETGFRINPSWTVQWDQVGDGSGAKG